MPDFKDIIPGSPHLMIIAVKGQPFPKFDKPETEKITRDAFLYMDSDEEEFAQCGTCWLMDKEKGRCAILGPDFEIDDDDSCGSYIRGEWVEGQPVVARATPDEVGFVQREVRCENCAHSDGSGKCLLYIKLNQKFPDIFNLDENISSKACCNANTPRSDVTENG